jgi:hypothetical protein
LIDHGLNLTSGVRFHFYAEAPPEPVIFSGVHPEAPASWRRGMIFKTPAIVDNAFAATLVRAAMHRTSLPHD